MDLAPKIPTTLIETLIGVPLSQTPITGLVFNANYVINLATLLESAAPALIILKIFLAQIIPHANPLLKGIGFSILELLTISPLTHTTYRPSLIIQALMM